MANSIGPLGQILYQGATINEFSGQVDFAKAHSAGLGAVYIRATAGCDYADANLSTYAAAARNAGLDVASGEYVIFCDSDDWIEPQMYERLCNMAQEKVNMKKRFFPF